MSKHFSRTRYKILSPNKIYISSTFSNKCKESSIILYYFTVAISVFFPFVQSKPKFESKSKPESRSESESKI